MIGSIRTLETRKHKLRHARKTTVKDNFTRRHEIYPMRIKYLLGKTIIQIALSVKATFFSKMKVPYNHNSARMEN